MLPGLLLALLTLLGSGVIVFAFWHRWRKVQQAYDELRRRALFDSAALAAAPLGCLVFLGVGGQARASSGLSREFGLDQGVIDFNALAIVFQRGTEASNPLIEAVEALRKEGTAFNEALIAKGRAYRVCGKRVQGQSGNTQADVVWFFDVSEEHRAMTNAEKDASELNSLLAHLPVPIWLRNTERKLVYCNASYAQAVEKSPKAVIEEGTELLGRAKADQALALADRALQADGPVTERHHAIVAGERRLFDITEMPIDKRTLLGFALDRTPIEDLESELNRHISAHAQLLENLGIAIAIFGPDQRLKFHNTAYATLFRLDEDFLRREPELSQILDALRENRRLPEYANFPEFKKQRQRDYRTLIEPLEELMHLTDGTTLRLVANVHPFGGVLETIEDVTDKLALERSYNTLTEVQRETLNKLYEAVAVYGADGRLKLYNPTFAEIWKLPSEFLDNEPHVREVTSRCRGFFDVADEEWPERLEYMVGRVCEPEMRSGRLVRADGMVYDWAQVPLPDGASLLTFLDVTDSFTVEQALLEKNEALETADRLKTEFIANISYELRTPLNAIVGFAEILENQFFGELNERQHEYSQAIVDSSQRLMALINDILDLATIEAGYLQLDLKEVEVREMLDHLKVIGNERARHRDIEIVIDCPGDIGEVTVDERRLTQALFNLLINAVKFSPEGGKVTVAARREEQELLLSVSDRGMGIQLGDQERVFEKFERGRGHAKQAGAGLGLSLVKSLVELHGGWIGLTSEIDIGTTVICHIPLLGEALEHEPLGGDQALGDASGSSGQSPAETPESEVAGSELLDVVRDVSAAIADEAFTEGEGDRNEKRQDESVENEPESAPEPSESEPMEPEPEDSELDEEKK